MFNDAHSFVKLLKGQGINFFSGVPCSNLKSLIKELISDEGVGYISATREDEAIGIAGGSYLAGKTPAVLMQNSGLGNSLNALTSFSLIYNIPCLILMGWRGYDGNDAPEHFVMGSINKELLDVIGVPYFVLEKDNIENVTIDAINLMRSKEKPVVILIKKG
ncbi:MAG: thiamine pyrophosphate-binding protein, partial [Candidatus Anammoxibacter sp.]